ncbi:MAG: (2Fe-2S)-binding protein, partial [Bacteroidales bacterium]|nr:(2Fe-2S)-binding protein [Bacteroidales bacterium]
MDQVKLTIDGKTVEVPKGTKIYKAAKELGIEIPILCYMDLKDLNIEH